MNRWILSVFSPYLLCTSANVWFFLLCRQFEYADCFLSFPPSLFFFTAFGSKCGNRRAGKRKEGRNCNLGLMVFRERDLCFRPTDEMFFFFRKEDKEGRKEESADFLLPLAGLYYYKAFAIIKGTSFFCKILSKCWLFQSGHCKITTRNARDYVLIAVQLRCN